MPKEKIKSWCVQNPEGLDFQQLYQIRETARDQRNNHRNAINSYLRYFISIFSGSFTALAALITFSLSEIDALDTFDRWAFLIIATLVGCGMTTIYKNIIGAADKEYKKMIEYLTVEQKIESLIGIRSAPLLTKETFDVDDIIFREDETLAYNRWVEDGKKYTKSSDFLEKTVSRKTVFITSLKAAFRAVYILNMAILAFLIIKISWPMVVIP